MTKSGLDLSGLRRVLSGWGLESGAKAERARIFRGTHELTAEQEKDSLVQYYVAMAVCRYLADARFGDAEDTLIFCPLDKRTFAARKGVEIVATYLSDELKKSCWQGCGYCELNTKEISLFASVLERLPLAASCKKRIVQHLVTKSFIENGALPENIELLAKQFGIGDKSLDEIEAQIAAKLSVS